MNCVGGTSLTRAPNSSLSGASTNVGGDRRHVGDDVDEQLAAGDAVEPALVDRLDGEAMVAEIGQELECIAGLGEDVDVLGRPVDPGVARQCIGARDEERYARPRHQLQHFGIEGLGRGRRLDQGAVGLARLGSHAAPQREAGAAGSVTDPRRRVGPAPNALQCQHFTSDTRRGRDSFPAWG